MRSREIPREQWEQFFTDFTRRHRGEHVDVETVQHVPPNVAAQLSDLPLVSIGDTSAGEDLGDWIEIVAGDSPPAPKSCSIACPTQVWLTERDDGAPVGLQVDTAAGIATVVRFHPPQQDDQSSPYMRGS